MRYLYPWLLMFLLPFIDPIPIAVLAMLWMPLVAVYDSVLGYSYFKSLSK